MRSSSSYPVYRLYWKNRGEVHRYYTKRKKSFLFTLNGLTETRNDDYVWFTVEYLPPINGEKIENTSRHYGLNEIKLAEKDARIFTSTDEIESIRSYWKQQ